MAYPPPPYADALCGTPVAGEAICGAWWAYPPQPGLLLGGHPPVVETISGDIVPAAGLKLGAFVPAIGIRMDVLVSPPAAGLLLGGYLPGLQISILLSVSPAGLLLGAYLPGAVGFLWMQPIECTDLALEPDLESELVLVGATAETIILEPSECR